MATSLKNFEIELEDSNISSYYFNKIFNNAKNNFNPEYKDSIHKIVSAKTNCDVAITSKEIYRDNIAIYMHCKGKNCENCSKFYKIQIQKKVNNRMHDTILSTAGPVDTRGERVLAPNENGLVSFQEKIEDISHQPTTNFFLYIGGNGKRELVIGDVIKKGLKLPEPIWMIIHGWKNELQFAFFHNIERHAGQKWTICSFS